MERLFKRNENENNEIVSKIFIGLAGFVLVVWVFCRWGIFDFNMQAASFFAGISIVALNIPVILIFVFHINKSFMKYVLIAILSLLMGLCYCIFTFQMVIVFLVPSLTAMLYMDKKLLYFSGVFNLIVVIGAHIVSAFFVLQPWLEPFAGVQDILRFGVIPRVMQLGLCSGILVLLMNRMLSYMQQLKNINAERAAVITEDNNVFRLEQNEYNSYLEKLTERERDVFVQMLLGKTNVQIADSLCLSTGTVKNYVSSIYDKIGTKERNYLILKFGRFAADCDQSNS